MVDYEYILFCYKVLKNGKTLKIDKPRLDKSKEILRSKDKSSYTEDDKLAIHRISFIESSLK